MNMYPPCRLKSILRKSEKKSRKAGDVKEIDI